MLIDKPIVLNKSVNFQEIGGLNGKLNDKLGGNNDDYIISLKGSRIHSKRINKDSKTFLDQFKQPKLFINAIYKFANENKLNTEDLLNNTYPFVKSFVQSGFLEYHTEKEQQNDYKQKLFHEKEHEYQDEIITCIQFLEDTEAYKAKDAQGNLFLLKCIRTHNQSLKDSLETELSILKKLNTQPNSYIPNYIESFEEEAYTILVMEWIDGKSLGDTIADKNSNSIQRSNIALEILEAYNYLQKHQVLHADIHPNNIKVTSTGEIKVFDFGSSIDAAKSVQETFFRAGILRYYEPELANALLEENKRVLATEASEQYQVAELIYLCIARNHYLDLPFETKAMLTHIATKPPRNFSDFNIKAKSLERVLKKALKKNPKDRYVSWQSFYKAAKKALQEPILEIEETVKPAYEGIEFDFSKYIDLFIEDYGYDSKKLNDFDISKPSCSFFHGATGIAYSFYRLSNLRKNPNLLSLADIWITLAERNMERENAFTNPEVGMPEEKAGRNSFFHRKTGLHAVKALVKNSLSYSEKSKHSVEKFISEVYKYLNFSSDHYALDPSQGSASYLFGINLLNGLNKFNKALPQKELDELSKSILGTLIPLIKSSLKESKSEQQYLGFAHGYAGLLYAILQMNPEFLAPYKKSLEEFLLFMKQQGTIDSKFAHWNVNSDKDTSAVWSGWCHGTAGHILLWVKAYEVLKNEDYLTLAKKAGNYLWKTYGKSNDSICCGLAGQSLAFYKLGQLTNNPEWFQKGRKVAIEAIDTVRSYTLDDSLFQGKVGIYLLAGESIDPTQAIFPLCESPIKH